MTSVDPLSLQIAQMYNLEQKIGCGSFGEIYLGVHSSHGTKVAVKLERITTPRPQLEHEAQIYLALQGAQGIPHLFGHGKERGFNFLVMELLGESLEDLYKICGRKFSVKTVLMIADQTISRVELFHSRGLLHRDIKPDNFLIGLGSKSKQIHIVDYGLAKVYRDAKTKQLIPCREGKHLTGTARYASINTHFGFEQACRDDLESLGYMFFYFFKGLPWQNLRANTKQEKYDRILMEKLAMSTDELCKGLPREFALYMHYCRALRYEDQPDYDFLKRLFKDLIVREGIHYDLMFDWNSRTLELENKEEETAESL